MKTTHIAAAFLVFLLSTSAFAQTNSIPGPGVHKAKIDPAPQGTLELKQDKKAERKAELAKMTPDERKAFKADRKAKKAAKLAAMTPEERKAYDEKKAQKKAAKKKKSE